MPIDTPIAARMNENSLICDPVIPVNKAVRAVNPNLGIRKRYISVFPMITNRAIKTGAIHPPLMPSSDKGTPKVTKKIAMNRFISGCTLRCRS